MKNLKNIDLIRSFVIVLFACVIVLSMASCQTAEQNGSGEAGQDAAAKEEPSDKDEKAENETPRIRKIKLKSGRTIRIDREGRVTRKSVYRLKAGTKITAKEIKKTGGSKRYFRIFKIKKDDKVYNRIVDKSYRPNSSVGLDDLRYIKTLYYDFDEKIRVGEIIVNKSIADDTREVFRELYKIKYQICRMRLVDSYFRSGASGGSAATDADTASMNDDNTSGFNYRMVAGTSTVSMHGYGRAIDVNPFENPWCPGGKPYHNQAASAAYANRSVRKPHMIFSDSDVTKIFKKYGFRWLGETGTRDYQHFEK